MEIRIPFRLALLGLLPAAFSACGDTPAEPDQQAASVDGGTAAARTGISLDDRLRALNDQLAAAGRPYRISELAMYTVGLGRSPVRILQRGTRWVPGDPRRVWNTATNPEDVTYAFDESDNTVDGLSVAASQAAIDAAFQSWSDVPRSYLDFESVPDGGGNYDILDAVPGDPFNDCAGFDGSDLSPIIDFGASGPYTDAIMGGWLDRKYFDCLNPDPQDPGGTFIIGVTWTFTFFDGQGNPVDADNDGYFDTSFKEIYFNDYFDWVDQGAVYLEPLFGAPNPLRVDVESIAVHEFGHVAELGHMGDVTAGFFNSRSARAGLGFLSRGKIFSPVAVMNPGYLGGEFRDLRSVDEAGYSTLFSDGIGRQ